MAKKRVPKIEFGEDTRKGRPQAGDIRQAQTEPPESDRLERLVKKSRTAYLAEKENAAKGRPKPGEVLSAEEPEDPERVKQDKVRDFLRLAHKRWQLASEAAAKWRSDAIDDLEFRAGKQWPDDIKSSRNIDGRPCLTLNRLPQFIRQVTNEQRQQRPAIQVNPVGDGADTDTAEVLQGIIRHIDNISDAEVAEDTAFDQMVTTGLGYFRIITDLIDEENNVQEILIRPIKNQFTVYIDPASELWDETDARYKFIVEDIPMVEYIERYKETALAREASLVEFTSIGDAAPEWATRETVRIAEYFYIDETTVNGKPHYQVKWAKINAIEIIEGNEDKTEGRDWPGKYIPIIPVVGDDLVVNGRRELSGLVRNLKDPQRMYNYWVSAATEMIALAPKAPFIGAEGQFENHEVEWQQTNVRNFAKLEYKPVSINGTPAPPPQRQVYEPPVQAINLMTRQADNDMKAGSGIYDASLGEKGPEQSGKAILERKKQGDLATLHWADNLARSIRHKGRVLIDLIPYIYDAPRVQRIFKPDQTVTQVITHAGPEQAQQAQAMVSDAVRKVYDIGTGRYDVTVSVGPSYQTKRQEAVAAQLALLQAVPELAPIIADLITANMDWPGAKQMAARLKKGLPPQFQDPDDGDPKTQLANLQAQNAQLMQQHDLLTQALNHEIQLRETKQIEIDGKAQIERERNQTQMQMKELDNRVKVLIAEITTAAQEAQARMKMENETWRDLGGQAHELAMRSADVGHETAMADKTHKQTLEQADVAHKQALKQQDQAGKQAIQQIKAKPKPNGKGGVN